MATESTIIDLPSLKKAKKGTQKQSRKQKERNLLSNSKILKMLFLQLKKEKEKEKKVYNVLFFDVAFGYEDWVSIIKIQIK